MKPMTCCTKRMETSGEEELFPVGGVEMVCFGDGTRGRVGVVIVIEEASVESF